MALVRFWGFYWHTVPSYLFFFLSNSLDIRANPTNNLLINGFCSSGLVHPPIRTTIIIIDLQKVCLENIISLLFLLKEFVQYCDIPRADFFDIL